MISLKGSHFFSSYIHGKYKRMISLKKATKQSKEDVALKIKAFLSHPRPAEFILLYRSLFNSSAWIGHSTMRYLLSLLDLSNKSNSYTPNEHESDILECVQVNKEIGYKKASHSEIFKIIFNDLEYSYYNPYYQTKLSLPKLDCTIVLISGVFNEIFSTPAFERAARHLKGQTGIKYFSPKVKGAKGTGHNQDLIFEQLSQYQKGHPDEKLWLIAFSKGGLDCLHFMTEHPEFAQKNIIGLSTIATPILGSDHLENKLFKLINKIHEYDRSWFYQLFNKRGDFLFKSFQESLSSKHQEDWFKKNYKKLPRGPFYSSVAFESDWYESHIWMMLTKAIFRSEELNDGIVDVTKALFPDYFKAINLGILRGHHLVGTRSSSYCQEALLEAHIIFLSYLRSTRGKPTL